MGKILYGVYGASGFGREVMPLVRKSHPDAEIVFVDDNPPAQVMNSHAVMTYEQFLKAQASEKQITLAIASGSVRKKLAEKCVKDNIKFFNTQAQNCVTMDDVYLAEGFILSPFVTLTSNIKIGKHFHANIYSYVAHDCVIGDYVTFAPGVMCNGNVIVEDGAYIGTGVVIKQGKPGEPLVIGANAMIGMGAVVTKSVPAGQTVVGNPARPMVR